MNKRKKTVMINTEGSFPIWTSDLSLFKDWCLNYFGPEADDSYLASAVLHLPLVNVDNTQLEIHQLKRQLADEINLTNILQEEIDYLKQTYKIYE